MVIQRTPTKIDKIVSLRIGQHQENVATQIKMDVSDWITVHPTAGFHILFKRPGEVQAQPVLSSLEGNVLTWNVGAWETASTGVGYAEVRAIEAESALVAKSRVIPCSIEDSIIEDEGEVPPAFEGWVNQVLSYKDDAEAAQTAAETAQEAAETAQTTAEAAATSASQDASAAYGWKEAAKGSANQAASSASQATTAAGTATAKAAEAQTAAQTATEKATAAADSERIATAKAEQATGAAQTATEKAGDASASATAAQASATDAASSATAASASETAAKASETAASTSASQAAQSVLDAGANAQTAMQKAAEASQSATNAATSATNAASSATDAANSATAAAGSEANAAQSAQAAASARDTAQTTVAGAIAGIQAEGATQVGAVQAKGEEVLDSIPSDYSTLSGDVSGLKSAITELEPKVDSLEINKADVIISSASGAIASFSDGADDLPVKSLSVAIEPVQDLHGYDHPWPAGGGVNLLPITIADTGSLNGVSWVVNKDDSGNVTSIALSGTATASTVLTVGNNLSIPGENKKLTGCPSGGGSTTYYMTARTSGAWLTNLDTGSGVGLYGTVDTVAIVIRPDVSVNNLLFKPMIAEPSVASYTPYSNICPITSHTGAKVTRTGINIWDEEWEIGSYDTATGQPIAQANTIRTKNYIRCIPNATYFYKNGSNQGSVVLFYDADQNFISYVNKDPNTTFTTPANANYISFRVYGSYGTTYNHDISINYPSTYTEYYAYQGQTYDITFPTEAGTVYGGELTVNDDGTGQVVVNLIDLDIVNKSWSYNSQSDTAAVFNFTIQLDSGFAPISNRFSRSIPSGSIGGMVYDGSINFYFAFPKNELSSIDENGVKAWLLQNPTTVIAKTKTPVTYTLTAPEIRTLLGQNNIWADTGDVAVSYPADTKLYIDNKITQAIAAALNA